MKVYGITNGVYNGQVSTLNKFGGIPNGFVEIEPPLLSEGQFAIFDFSNRVWDIVLELPAPPTPEPTPEPVPLSITPRQARLKLLETDLLDDLEAVITTNRAWQIEWEYATEVKRDSPLIDAVSVQAGLTNEQIDQMFIEASKL